MLEKRGATKKDIFKIMSFYLAPVLLLGLFKLEILYFFEKTVLGIFIVWYSAIQYKWFAVSIWRKIINTIIFTASLVFFLLNLLLSLGDIFGGGLKDRYLSLGEMTLYYVMEDPHFYEEVTLRLKSVYFFGAEEINSDSYQNGVGAVEVKKENGIVFYSTEYGGI